jgi:ketosteroid isomerase-like protein
MERQAGDGKTAGRRFGKRVTTTGADIYRVADGKIAQVWTAGDDLGLLMLLGAIPAFGEAMATP